MLEKTVYQFHIALEYIRPLIWRRFLVREDITLDKLHKIIQIVMGWEDRHLHEFRIDGNRYGEPEREWNLKVHNDKKLQLKKLKLKEKQKFVYVYDFGDDWEHEIELEENTVFRKWCNIPKMRGWSNGMPSRGLFWASGI